ncbi:MAG: aldo/keto reductase [Alicyclobacillus herbarius]|uniref:aldo/keto reductase n=1 Tax=Alicyclobacillus herbarius TaxID=122960 RepID=UPI0023566C23|nr:aldo/keto reductase [Alicyclobacillus herbarius]MCL6633856.1 aldo/keto reductase [Alicyclobacillus herbarius]
MEQRFVGKTGLLVSELCLGAMTFGREASKEESFRILNEFVEAGGNFIDTANVYSQGLSEEIVGEWLQTQRRSDYVIATKVRFSMGKAANDVGLSRKHIFDAVEASLRRLKTDYIDLYQVHAWDPKTPLEETLGALDDLVHKGYVRYIGASNFRGWQLAKALGISRELKLASFVCLQPQYNLLCRATEYELLPLCKSEGLGIIPWSPLRGGWLSGKYKRGMQAPLENTRIAEAEKHGWGESWTNYNNEYTWRVLDALDAVSKEVGKSHAQVAINWLLNHPEVTAPIIGARNVEQLRDNLGASGWTLAPEHRSLLDAASELPVSYPYDLGAEMQQQRR